MADHERAHHSATMSQLQQETDAWRAAVMDPRIVAGGCSGDAEGGDGEPIPEEVRLELRLLVRQEWQTRGSAELTEAAVRALLVETWGSGDPGQSVQQQHAVEFRAENDGRAKLVLAEKRERLRHAHRFERLAEVASLWEDCSGALVTAAAGRTAPAAETDAQVRSAEILLRLNCATRKEQESRAALVRAGARERSEIAEEESVEAGLHLAPPPTRMIQGGQAKALRDWLQGAELWRAAARRRAKGAALPSPLASADGKDAPGGGGLDDILAARLLLFQRRCLLRGEDVGRVELRHDETVARGIVALRRRLRVEARARHTAVLQP
eukprot:TRINITY_DN24736_c0_g1_i1.p1 TRINITY_DN24736_c0_g1~~TRINITY_DN24736_c0_g1_i1.p1  ORF type:complete len:345 (+),score=140.62 TRINITY_DN24736_c0_g1_i1:61-1035(+)